MSCLNEFKKDIAATYLGGGEEIESGLALLAAIAFFAGRTTWSVDSDGSREARFSGRPQRTGRPIVALRSLLAPLASRPWRTHALAAGDVSFGPAQSVEPRLELPDAVVGHVVGLLQLDNPNDAVGRQTRRRQTQRPQKHHVTVRPTAGPRATFRLARRHHSAAGRHFARISAKDDIQGTGVKYQIDSTRKKHLIPTDFRGVKLTKSTLFFEVIGVRQAFEKVAKLHVTASSGSTVDWKGQRCCRHARSTAEGSEAGACPEMPTASVNATERWRSSHCHLSFFYVFSLF